MNNLSEYFTKLKTDISNLPVNLTNDATLVDNGNYEVSA